MNSSGSPSPDDEHQVLNFKRGNPPRPPAAANPVEDLAKYERAKSDDDYRHRMIVNVVAFLFIAVLIAAGYWIADTMARMRKNQDCVLSGRRNCAPIEVNRDRW